MKYTGVKGNWTQEGTIRDKAYNHEGGRNTPGTEVKLTQGHKKQENTK